MFNVNFTLSRFHFEIAHRSVDPTVNPITLALNSVELGPYGASFTVKNGQALMQRGEQFYIAHLGSELTELLRRYGTHGAGAFEYFKSKRHELVFSAFWTAYLMPLRVILTVDDVLRGTGSNCTSCPVALAIQRELNTLRPESYLAKVYKTTFSIESDLLMYGGLLPAPYVRFIKDFDTLYHDATTTGKQTMLEPVTLRQWAMSRLAVGTPNFLHAVRHNIPTGAKS